MKTTRLVDKIEAYLCAADTKKPLTEFDFDYTAPPSVVIKLFKKLLAEWCVEGFEHQRRRKFRFKSSKLLNVSFGLEDIYRRIEQIRKNKELQAIPST